MALGPKEMGEAIIRNLKEKTGKSIQEWIEILKNDTLEEKKEILNFLKTEKGLGHFQAQKIFENFKGQDPYKNPAEFSNSLFHSKESKELYEYAKAKIIDFANDIRVQPCKTYIPFYRKKQFAVLTTTMGGKILLGLNLPDNYISARLSSPSTKVGDRINSQIVLGEKSDLDKEVMEMISTAYQNN